MLVSARLCRFIQIGASQNLFSNLTKQHSLGTAYTQKLCTQNQSTGSVNEEDSNTESEKKSSTSRYMQPFNPELVKKLTLQMKGDMPLETMADPFEKKYRRCLLCEKNIDLDWKNIQLLSQFVSPFTGRIYGRHITGLCIPMQKRVARLIKRAREFGYMSYMNKDPRYLNDPKLFDPFRPRRKKTV